MHHHSSIADLIESKTSKFSEVSWDSSAGKNSGERWLRVFLWVRWNSKFNLTIVAIRESDWNFIASDKFLVKFMDVKTGSGSLKTTEEKITQKIKSLGRRGCWCWNEIVERIWCEYRFRPINLTAERADSKWQYWVIALPSHNENKANCKIARACCCEVKGSLV
jgi:hypothetical protein